MSRFNGWVPYRRGILDHVLADRLTGFEHHALTVLILLADASTGGDRINAPLLCYYTGQMFSQDTAQRLLNSLHEKSYVWYRAKPYSKKPQPYWVNKYELTKGLYKLRRINLSQLLNKSIISQQEVWDSAVQTTEQDAVQTAEQHADNYKTGYMRKETKDKTRIGQQSECAVSDSLNSSQTVREALNSAGVKDSRVHRECITTASLPTVKHTPRNWKWGDPVPGYEFRCGENAGYYFDGVRISPEQARRLNESGGKP